MRLSLSQLTRVAGIGKICLGPRLEPRSVHTLRTPRNNIIIKQCEEALSSKGKHNVGCTKDLVIVLDEVTQCTRQLIMTIVCMHVHMHALNIERFDSGQTARRSEFSCMCMNRRPCKHGRGRAKGIQTVSTKQVLGVFWILLCLASTQTV